MSSELDFTPLWYVKIKRDKLNKVYKNAAIILDIVLILIALIFTGTLVK